MWWLAAVCCGVPPCAVCVCQAVFESAAPQLMAATVGQLWAGLNVQYVDHLGQAEQGIDSGGLTNEFFSSICAELLAPVQGPEGQGQDPPPLSPPPGLVRTRSSKAVGAGEPMFRALPDASLFLRAAGARRPLMFYMALGRLVGMTVLYACAPAQRPVLTGSFSSALLKCLLNSPIAIEDVRAVDPMYYKNRIESLLKPGGVEEMAAILGDDALYFVDMDDPEEPPLKPGGGELRVTEGNKAEYVALISEHYLCGKVRRELSEFLQVCKAPPPPAAPLAQPTVHAAPN